MSRDELLYIEDILKSCESVIEYTSGFTKESFIEDSKTYDAVLWKLQIIGEESRKISDATKENYPNIAWHKIRSFRNIITHEYFGIDAEIVWQVIQNHIPKLKKQLQQLKYDSKE